MRRLAGGMLLMSMMVWAGKDPKSPRSELDRFLAETPPVQTNSERAAGSLYEEGSPLLNLAADLRARRVNDLVTIVVFDRASAIVRGATKSVRSSSAQASINSLAGTPPAAERLTRLLDLGSNSQLDGQGETSRETVLNTTLTARVTRVLPNGLLVVEGAKSVRINSEIQQIGVRGVVRAVDLTSNNRVFSDALAYLEIKVNGKGVVGDAIRRPNFLYRILLGILPF